MQHFRTKKIVVGAADQDAARPFEFKDNPRLILRYFNQIIPN